MPVHRVLASDLEAEVERIEQSERIVAVAPSGDGAFIVLTEGRTRPGGVEKR